MLRKTIRTSVLVLLKRKLIVLRSCFNLDWMFFASLIVSPRLQYSTCI
jgi:hypothetical protein